MSEGQGTVIQFPENRSVRSERGELSGAIARVVIPPEFIDITANYFSGEPKSIDEESIVKTSQAGLKEAMLRLIDEASLQDAKALEGNAYQAAALGASAEELATIIDSTAEALIKRHRRLLEERAQQNIATVAHLEDQRNQRAAEARAQIRLIYSEKANS